MHNACHPHQQRQRTPPPPPPGMYDYSGEFAFSMGFPSKCGISGAILIVIPGVLGMCTFSPRLDASRNSVRGIAFCKALCQRFALHNYDTLDLYVQAISLARCRTGLVLPRQCYCSRSIASSTRTPRHACRIHNGAVCRRREIGAVVRCGVGLLCVVVQHHV
jgi:hypothetical protein